MKALKEKRIGLRSLWRRGLVILSLFALVFASCDSSDGGGGGGTTVAAKVPLEIRTKTHPTAKSYEGKPVDLTGIVIEARYDTAPNTWVAVTDLSKYGTFPKYTQRRYDGTTGLAADGDVDGRYVIYALGDGEPVYTTFNVKVSNLDRTDTNNNGTPTGSAGNTGVNYPGNTTWVSDSGFQWAQGVQVHVNLPDGYKKKYRVDDFPDFSGITLQGTYMDGTMQDIPISMDMRWEIRPRYDATPSTATGKGDLIIAVGGLTASSGRFTSNNFSNAFASLWNATGTAGYATTNDNSLPIAVSVPLDEVYHVNGIEVENLSELQESMPPFFFWQDDRPSAWLNGTGTGGRAAKAVIKVTYSDGLTRSMSMEEAVRQNTVYWNFNPAQTERPLTVQGINDSALNVDQVKTYWPNHKDPKIYIYYRGYKTAVSVPVYTRFTGITAVAKDGGELVADMKRADNDNRGFSASDFAKLITVTANFSAYSDSSKTAPLVLDYQGIRPYNAARPDDNESGTPGTTTPTAVKGTPYDTAARAVAALGKPYRALGSGANRANTAQTEFIATWANDGDAGSRKGPYPTWYNSGRVAVTTSGQGNPDNVASGVTTHNDQEANLTYDGGPTVYTMNFGDPNYWWDNAAKMWKLGDNAWGESAVAGNNGRTRNVSIYYTPGIGPGPAASYYVAGTTPGPTDAIKGGTVDDFYLPWAPEGPAVRTARLPVTWKNIPTKHRNPTLWGEEE